MLEENGDEVPMEDGFFSFENLAGVDEDPLSNPSFNDDNEGQSFNEDSIKSYVPKGKRSQREKKCLIKVVQVGRKRKQTSKTTPNRSTQKFQTKKEFIAEMDKVIKDVLNESVLLFQKDPREYHPYYLRMYKYISLGQQSGFLGSSSKQVRFIWDKYEKLCEEKISNLDEKRFFNGIESPYAVFIKTGKVIVNGKEIIQSRNELEVDKRMEELEQVAKEIVEKWRKKRGRKKDIRSDLGRRLEFFENCKTMTFPGDCVRMNNIWTQFLNQFETSSCPVVLEFVPEVKKEVLEEPVEDLDSFIPPWSTENHQPVTDNEDDKMLIKPFKQQFGKHHTALLKKPKGMSSILKVRRLQKLNKKTEMKRQLQLEKALCNPSGPPPKKAKRFTSQPIPKEVGSSCISSKKAADGSKLNKKISPMKLAKLTLKSKKRVFVSKLKKKLGSATNTSLLEAKLEKVICQRKPPKSKSKPNETKQIESPLKEVADPVIAEMEQEEDASMGPCMCEECGEIFSSKQEVIQHKETAHFQNSLQESGFSQGLEKDAVEKNGAVPPNPMETEKGTIPSKTRYSPCCHICGKIFTRIGTLNRHISFRHSSKISTNLCPHCGKKYKAKDTMMAHIREVHMGQVFLCDICGRNLKAAGKLWKHKVDFHSMNDLPPPPDLLVFECLICKEKILRGIKQHMEKKHPGEDGSSYQIVNRKREKVDARLEKGVGPASLKKPKKPKRKKYDRFSNLGKRLIPTTCPQCGFTFEKKKNKLSLWEEHMKEAHGITEKFACEVGRCNSKFILENGLELHMKAKHLTEYLIKIEAVQRNGSSTLEKWDCMICSEILNRNEIAVHFNGKHQQAMEMLRIGIAPEKTLECPLCKEKANDEGNLRSHLESCHPDNALICPECKKSITSNEEFQEHFLLFHLPMERIPPRAWKVIEKIRLIPEEKNGGNHLPFVCPICSARFSVLLELITHAERNHSDKIFHCKECPTVAKLTERAYYYHLINSQHSSQLFKKDLDPMLKKKMFFDWEMNCQLCGSEFQIGHFNIHLKNFHKLVENGKLFECACPKQIANREKWMTHMEEVHGGKPEELFEIAKKINVTEDVDLDKYRQTETRKRRTSKRTKKTKKGSSDSELSAFDD